MTGVITLTAAMRANLQSLQGTQSLLDQTQLRLATGNKVNSALDNPVNFFAAQTLSNRAGDLSALLDGLGQGIQVLKTTDQAITSLTSYVNQLKSIANSAKSALSGAAVTSEITSTVDITAAQAADLTNDTQTLTGTVTVAATDVVDNAAGLNLTVGKKLTLTHGTDTAVYTVVSGETVQDLVDAINGDANGNGHITAAIVGGKLTITSDDATAVTTNDDDTQAIISALGIDDGSGGQGTTVANTPVFAAASTFTVSAGGVDSLITVADGTSLAALATQITAASGGAYTATVVADEDDATLSHLKIVSADKSVPVTFTDGTNTPLAALGIGATTVSVTNLDSVATYQTSYANVITQITQTASDASYQGSNLIDGTSGNLTIQVNEKSTKPITVTNTALNATGLGLDATVTWTSTATIQASIDKITAALATLRTTAGSFANNLSLIQTRQDFTKNLINTLTDGASQLTIADKNEEGANLLALQTSQQLGIQALALSSQANQSVLRLFS